MDQVMVQYKEISGTWGNKLPPIKSYYTSVPYQTELHVPY
jgi:hypothetical protein